MKKISELILSGKYSNKTVRILIIAGLLSAYIISVRFALNFNNFPVNDWRSELFSDKGGYYIYLPATFLYGYHQSAYPEGIEYKMGHGFRFENGKLFTKYPPGVAILVSPFFFAAHLLALSGQGPADGFSTVYYDLANYSAVFYMMLGSIILFKFLRRRYSMWISFMTVVFIVFGTNVYSYTFHEPMMSHIYSFSVFALLLLLTDNLWRYPKWLNLVWISLTAGMLLLIRPANLLFLLVIPFLDLSSYKQFIGRLRFLFKPLNIITIILGVVLVFTPQLVYWKFISGNFIYYSYEGEGFIYWKNPQVLAVLFAPLNGLFPYTPGFIFVITGFIVMIISKKLNRWLVPLIFVIVLYMVSSWHSYPFGCSFGQRSFVEYYSIFTLPVASLFNLCFQRKQKILMVIISLMMTYLFYVNIKLSNVYNRCYFGEVWNYSPYRNYFSEGRIFPFHKNTFRWHNDFEKKKYYTGVERTIIKSPLAFNGECVSMIKDTLPYSSGFNARLFEVISGNLNKVEVQFECYFAEQPDETRLVCSILEGDRDIFYETRRIDDLPNTITGHWIKYQYTFDVPSISRNHFIKVFVWGMKGKEVLIDDMDVKLHFGEKNN